MRKNDRWRSVIDDVAPSVCERMTCSVNMYIITNKYDWRKRPPPWHVLCLSVLRRYAECIILMCFSIPPWHFFAFSCHGGALHYTSENLSVSWTRGVQPALRQWCTAYASLGHFSHKRWPKSSFWRENQYRLCKFRPKVAQAVRIDTGFCRWSCISGSTEKVGW